MWRLAIAVSVVVASGCIGVEPEPAPAPAPDVDGGIAAPHTDSVGDHCSRSGAFCDDYTSVCAHGTCRAQCSPVSYPLCGTGGATEVHEHIGDSDWCYCVPE